MSSLNPLAWLNRMSVGVKLSASLVLVVLLTAAVLSIVQESLTSQFLDKHASMQLREQVGLATKVLGLTSRQTPYVHEALDLAYAELKDSLDSQEAIYALDEKGNSFAPSTLRGFTLPDRRTLKTILEAGKGLLRTQQDGGEVWLGFQRTTKGNLVLVIQASQEMLVGHATRDLRNSFMMAALALSILVGVVAVWLARRELVNPLRRLAEEAECVAGGDLTPPRPLPGRLDEVGRLSRVLSAMTLAAQQMIEDAQASQASFQQLFTDNRDAIIIIDDEDKIEAVNPASAQIFGFKTVDELRQLASSHGLFVDPAERQYYLELLQDQGFVKDFPAQMRRKDGSSFNVLITATLRGRNARFALVRDVTQTLAAQRALLESEERYRRLLENAPDMIYRWNIKERCFDYLSPATEAVTGYSASQAIAEPDLLWQMVHPDSKEQVLDHWRTQVRGEGPNFFEHEFRFMHRSGQTRWIRERSILLRDHDGKPMAIESLATDVTQSKLMEEALRKGQVMVESTLQGLPAAVMVVDQDHKVVHWNKAMERLSGIPAQEVVGTNGQWRSFYDEPRPVLADLILDMDWNAIKRLYGDKGLKPSPVIGGGLECEDYYVNLNGADRHLYFLAAPILDEDGRVVRAVETLVDLTDKRALEDELRRLSVTDDLTGLYNQRFFYATLGREVEAARRYGAPLALLLLDLDHFKVYNDSYGHLEGDRVLRRFADSMQTAVRATDLACRYGGEEFVVLLPHTDLEEALVVAERIRQGVEDLEFYPVVPGQGQRKARITVSVGASLYNSKGDMNEFVRQADVAMYSAKEAGRNRVALYRGEGEVEVFERPMPSSQKAHLKPA
jgi:diguanylate cyclase (GGDEF)-like protein/PAS domain S-box-containing protein